MKWSWRLVRIAGIDVRVHATFFLLLVWVAMSTLRDSGTGIDILVGILLTLAFFASVVMHEYGHALTARRFGIGTADITLLPIGGVARLERIPEQPKQELIIALAGPAVSVGVFAALWAAQRIAGTLPGGFDALYDGGDISFVAQLMWANAALAVFNLLPAFPMDGGRVLRALLAMRMPHPRATTIAVTIGRVFAVMFVLAAWYLSTPMLVLIALFIWIGGAAEASARQAKSALTGLPVGRVMISNMRMLSPGDAIATAVEHALAGFQHDFLVVDHGVVVGVLTRNGLAKALADRGPDARVGDVMDRQLQATVPAEQLEGAVARLQLPYSWEGRFEA